MNMHGQDFWEQEEHSNLKIKNRSREIESRDAMTFGKAPLMLGMKKNRGLHLELKKVGVKPVMGLMSGLKLFAVLIT